MLPSGIVVQSSWLTEQGYSPSLQQRYRTNQWLKPLGQGAMVRPNDEVKYEGAIYALQSQSNMSIHPAGKTALSLQGKTHYIELGSSKVLLFGAKGERLPSWFTKHDWGQKVDYHSSSFLPPHLGMMDIPLKNFSIRISDPIRAVMECIHLAPKEEDLFECYELIQGLNNLRPNKVQEMLEQCQSIKVKRLFLYLADKIGHDWFKQINLEKIDLGKGKRSVVRDGFYIAKYQITVPKAFIDYGREV